MCIWIYAFRDVRFDKQFMTILRYIWAAEFLLIGIAFMIAGILLLHSLRQLSVTKYKSMKIRVTASVVVTTTALILRGGYLLLLNNFDAEKYLIIYSIQNDDWIFPWFIAFYFGFEDLVPISAQIVSAWRSIVNNKATFPIKSNEASLTHFEEEPGSNSEYDYISSSRSNYVSLAQMKSSTLQ